MAGEPLWDSAKEIVLKMRDIIQSNTADRLRQSRFGWQYRLLNESIAMKKDMEGQGYKVRPLTIFHNISNSFYSGP